MDEWFISQMNGKFHRFITIDLFLKCQVGCVCGVHRQPKKVSRGRRSGMSKIAFVIIAFRGGARRKTPSSQIWSAHMHVYAHVYFIVCISLVALDREQEWSQRRNFRYMIFLMSDFGFLTSFSLSTHRRTLKVCLCMTATNFLSNFSDCAIRSQMELSYFSPSVAVIGNAHWAHNRSESLCKLCLPLSRYMICKQERFSPKELVIDQSFGISYWTEIVY